MQYLLLLSLIATSLVYGQEGEETWEGTYDVYEPQVEGWRRSEALAFEITRAGDTYTLSRIGPGKIAPIELVEGKGQLRSKGGHPIPVIRKQAVLGPNVLQLAFSFRFYTLVKGDVPKWWVMDGERIEIDETLFKDVSDATSNVPIPADLKQTYSKFVRWHSGKWRYTDLFLTESVNFWDTTAEKSHGKPLNTCVLLTDVFDERFNPKVLQLFSIQGGCYKMRTASTEFLWIQTKAGDWRIYHYRDLADREWQPPEVNPKRDGATSEPGSVETLNP